MCARPAEGTLRIYCGAKRWWWFDFGFELARFGHRGCLGRVSLSSSSVSVSCSSAAAAKYYVYKRDDRSSEIRNRKKGNERSWALVRRWCAPARLDRCRAGPSTGVQHFQFQKLLFKVILLFTLSYIHISIHSISFPYINKQRVWIWMCKIKNGSYICMR